MITLRRIMSLIIGLAFIAGCAGSSRTVNRVAVDQSSDISGRWNDTDARMTAEYMVRELLSRNWLSDFEEKHDKKPFLIVDKIKNRTSEHLDPAVFVKEIEKELINSGQVYFVASKKEREAVRGERMDQQSYASFDSAKELAKEQAADFMLRGTITSVVDKFDT